MPFERPTWAAPPTHSVSLKLAGQTFDIGTKDSYVLGRALDADIPLSSDKVSRNHAAIVHHTSGSVYIIDLDSTHGTFVNGHKLPVHKPTKLSHNQRLTFGGLPQDAVVRFAKDADSVPDQMRASHLLVKHRDVRRPSSWKEPTVTRSREEALAMIQQFHEQLTSGDASTLPDRFAQLASVESHCSSAKRGGDLGPFERGQMQKPFEEATLALGVGELSGPVYTDSGVHLILRTG